MVIFFRLLNHLDPKVRAVFESKYSQKSELIGVNNKPSNIIQ